MAVILAQIIVLERFFFQNVQNFTSFHMDFSHFKLLK